MIEIKSNKKKVSNFNMISSFSSILPRLNIKFAINYVNMMKSREEINTNHIFHFLCSTLYSTK